MDDVVFVGYGGANIGDLSYPVVFKRAFPQKKIDFVSKVDKEYRIGVLGGGNIAFDPYLKQIENCHSKYAVSISVNEGSNFAALKSYKRIIVRDLASQRMLKEHEIESIYAPDFTLLLKPNPTNGRKLIERYFGGADLYNRVVCVSLNSYLLYSPEHSRPVRDEAHLQEFIYNFADLMDNTNASFILLPFSTDSRFDDRIISGMAAKNAKFYKKNVVVYDKLSYKQTLDIISAADGLIGSRLHSLIFSFIGGRPFIDIYHDSKTKSFIESVGVGQSVSYIDFNKLECKSLLEDIFENEEQLSGNILKSLGEQRQILNEVIKDVDFS